MLADRAFCDLVRHIGIASLGADDTQIWHLTKIYWCVCVCVKGWVGGGRFGMPLGLMLMPFPRPCGHTSQQKREAEVLLGDVAHGWGVGRSHPPWLPPSLLGKQVHCGVWGGA